MTGSVTPIRPSGPQDPPPPENRELIDAWLADKIDVIRVRVFEAMGVVGVAAASFSHDVNRGEPDYRRVLDLVHRELDAIAAALEPETLERAAAEARSDAKTPAGGSE